MRPDSAKSPTRALWASRKLMNAKLQNGQHGSEFKAMLKENSGWKKFKPGGEVNLLMRFGERCTGYTTEMQDRNSSTCSGRLRGTRRRTLTT